MEEYAIETRNLSKRFGELVAVDGIGFEVKKGEIFGFLGPNGAGKTTTIRMLTGLLTPDAGDVFIDGINMSKAPIKAKMRMGIIPEMGNIYIDLSAKENIILAGRFYGVSRKKLEEKTDRLLGQLGLFGRKDDPVKNLSKGLKQRVNIASAIVHSPEILFLDEPTAGLDVQSQRLIRDIVRKMREEGTTIFLTTHNIEEANMLCERVGIINKGKIAAIDTPERLKRTFEETQSIEVSFGRPTDDFMFKEWRTVSKIERMGDKWRLYTHTPDRLVKQLTKFAEDKHLTILSLNIWGASLEDVFVRLTER